MARRRYGAGAVKRRSDGRWEGQLRLPDGRRQYVYAADQRQVVSRLQEERWRTAAGIPRQANGLTLGEYLPEWLEVCRGRLRPKTFDSHALCAHRVELRGRRSRPRPALVEPAGPALGSGSSSPGSTGRPGSASARCCGSTSAAASRRVTPHLAHTEGRVKCAFR